MYKTSVCPTFTHLTLYRIGERMRMEHTNNSLCPDICFGTSVLPGYSFSLAFSPFFPPHLFPSHFTDPLFEQSQSLLLFVLFLVSLYHFWSCHPHIVHTQEDCSVSEEQEIVYGWLLFFMKASSKHDKGVGSLAVQFVVSEMRNQGKILLGPRWGFGRPRWKNRVRFQRKNRRNSAALKSVSWEVMATVLYLSAGNGSATAQVIVSKTNVWNWMTAVWCLIFAPRLGQPKCSGRQSSVA